MSPSKPIGAIKIKVPRHNAQRAGQLADEVDAVARAEGVRVDTRQSNHEPSSLLSQAIESASEWNSLLTTARAERGPQWDVGTQQFQVDEGSELYYDATPLFEAQKQQRGDEAPSASDRGSMQPPDFLTGHSPQTHRPTNPYPYAASRYPGAPSFNTIPPNQFYADTSSPARIGMSHDGMSMSPEVRRRVTRGMVDDGYPGL